MERGAAFGPVCIWGCKVAGRRGNTVWCCVLPPYQLLNSCSSILDAAPGKRASSFVFQVAPTIDFTYLTRSIHTSFKGSTGMEAEDSCAAAADLIWQLSVISSSDWDSYSNYF